jgi:hypothetical protein
LIENDIEFAIIAFRQYWVIYTTPIPPRYPTDDDDDDDDNNKKIITSPHLHPLPKKIKRAV